jgi:hypothetical protein
LVPDYTIIPIYPAISATQCDPNAPLEPTLTYTAATIADIKASLKRAGYLVVAIDRVKDVHYNTAVSIEELRIAPGLRNHVRGSQGPCIGREMEKAGAILFEEHDIGWEQYPPRVLMCASARVILPKPEETN